MMTAVKRIVGGGGRGMFSFVEEGERNVGPLVEIRGIRRGVPRLNYVCRVSKKLTT